MAMKEYEIRNSTAGLRVVNPDELYRARTPRMLHSSILLPSQYQAYSVCVEFAKEWFVEKFHEHFFNSIYVDGTHSFDEFRKFSDIDSKLKHTKPLLAIVPTIDITRNRDWVDSTPEMPLMLRRSRMEGTFFNDDRDGRGLHLQLMFKTIVMNFVFKMRLDTRAEQLDMLEHIKINHRAGYTETRNLDLDIHVPYGVITQLAFDNNFTMDSMGHPLSPIDMLAYLNSYSVLPFLYKLRCSTGNKEYFVKVPNCVAHIKTEVPSFDDGDRQDMVMTNYTIDFPVEIEMTAPYCYTYYSQFEHCYMDSHPADPADAVISLAKAIRTDFPTEDENHWQLNTKTEYEVDDEDLNKPLDICMYDFFRGSELQQLIDYNLKAGLSPGLFLNFIFFNDGVELKYTVDWETITIHIEKGIVTNTTSIGVYYNMKYINETLIYMKELNEQNSSRIH